MLLVAAMGPPGGGRMVISRRLQSRFNLINMTFPQVGSRVLVALPVTLPSKLCYIYVVDMKNLIVNKIHLNKIFN